MDKKKKRKLDRKINTVSKALEALSMVLIVWNEIRGMLIGHFKKGALSIWEFFFLNK